MIKIDGIVKRFGDLEVLKGISFDIPYGEVAAIVGPSGAGKTTLLQIIGTLDHPDSGRVIYDDVDVLKLNDNALSKFRNQNIGFVFQFHRLLPEFTLCENVAMPALIAGIDKKTSMAEAMRLIDYMGLSDRAMHKPSQLSGGECQRAAVARALINKPRVVLADEPSGSLDSKNRKELHKLFFEICADMGATFIIVTHDENLASECHRVIHMRDGMIEKISI